jgi:hypothetical protein
MCKVKANGRTRRARRLQEPRFCVNVNSSSNPFGRHMTSTNRLLLARVEGVATNIKKRFFPYSPRRGVCAIKKKLRSILSSRRRRGVQPQQDSVEFDHHPGRSRKEAARYFIDVAPTPPRRGGEIADLCFLATALSALAKLIRRTVASAGSDLHLTETQ